MNGPRLAGPTRCGASDPANASGSVSRFAERKRVVPDEKCFLQPGRNQVAAGFAVYGPTTQLVITVGDGAFGFTLDRETYTFVLTNAAIRIPEDTAEFAINASNMRRWEAPVKRYIDECLAGKDGPGSMKSQFKRADSSGARFALIFGADELAQGCVTLKSLRDGSGAQSLQSLTEVAQWAATLQSRT